MSFASGSMTFRRFFVENASISEPDDGLIERLRRRCVDADATRMQDGTVWGWTTGAHLLDTDFSLLKNAVGQGLYFALRVDTHRPPSDLVRSYQRQAEEAMLESSGREFLSRSERREAREQARSRAEAEAKAGAFRRMKQIPVYWDLASGQVFVGSTSLAVLDQFAVLFHRTFDLPATVATSGEVAFRWATQAAEMTAYDALRPAHFVHPPEGAEMPEEMVRTAQAGSRDFLGTEWLLWLWYASHVESPDIRLGTGQSVSVLFEKSLHLECAFALTGKATLTGDGPTRMPEAAVALAGGKRPMRATLHLAARGEVYELGLRGDLMNISSLRLPPPEEAKSSKALLEERMEGLRRLMEALDGLYGAFLRRRLSSRWSQTLTAMRTWIAGGQPATVPAPAELTA